MPESTNAVLRAIQAAKLIHAMRTVALFLILFPIILNGQSNCVPAPEGLVSWWRAEGNALDQTGGNNGVIDGDVTFGPGEVGEAFVFSGNNCGVEVGSPGNLQLQNFTLEAWIQRATNTVTTLGNSNAGCIFSTHFGWAVGIYNDGIPFLSDPKSGKEVDSPVGLTDTAWHHIALTKDGTNVVFYIDGNGYTAAPFSDTFYFSGEAAIGGRYSEGVFYESFYGSIDELSIYDQALQTSEIQAIYDAGSAGKCLTLTSPYIFGEPTNVTIFGGNGATFSVVATGAEPLSYQWLFDGTNISEATNATFTITNAQVSENGTYSVIVSNSYGTLPSSNAVLTVDLTPDISSQPTNETVEAYYPATFSVTASGPLPLQYQWTFNGTNISGATDSTLVIDDVQPTNAGSYSVIVGTPPNTTNSSNALLTVALPPPIILTEPQSHIGVVGDYTTFTVTAQSQLPATMYYQWSFAGTNIAGATNAELVISNLTLANAGTYAVEVYNQLVSTNSPPAVLTMIAAPTGTNHIVANLDPNELTQAVQAGGSVTFVCDGTFTLSAPIALSQDVVVDGTNHALSLSGGGGSQLLAVPSGVRVTLRNLTLSGGSAIQGGAISNGGALTVSGVNFLGNHAASMGGAVFNSGSLTLSDAVFSGNAAEASGSSSAYGGGLFNQGGTISMQGVCFNENVAQGGSDYGFYFEGPATQGYGFGGALCSMGGSVAASGIDCTNNAALSGQGNPGFYEGSGQGTPGAGLGGAFFLTNCAAILSNGCFVGNTSTCSPAYLDSPVNSEGGAVFNAGWMELSGIEFISNNCPGINGIDGDDLYDGLAGAQQGGAAGGATGGAVYNMGLLEMTNCTFLDNSVTGGAGGAGSDCDLCQPQQTGPSGPPSAALGGALANFATVICVSNAFLNNFATGPGSDVGTIYSVSDFEIDANTTISPDTVYSVGGPLAPILVIVPQSEVVAVGSTITLQAMAAGSPPPTYQWTFNGTNIVSATDATLVLTNVQLAQTGTYTVIAVNSQGIQTSAPVTVTLSPISLNLSGSSLGSAGFSITVTGDAAVNFVIEGSTDLLNWEPLQTNPLPFTFVDTNAAANPYRFYRAVETQ